MPSLIIKSTHPITLLIPTNDDRMVRKIFPSPIEIRSTKVLLIEIESSEEIVELHQLIDGDGDESKELEYCIRNSYFNFEECKKIFENDSLLTIKPFFKEKFIYSLRNELNSLSFYEVGPFDYRSYGNPHNLEGDNLLLLLDTIMKDGDNPFIHTIKKLTNLEEYSLILGGWEITLIREESYQLLNSRHVTNSLRNNNLIDVYISLKSDQNSAEDECIGGDLVYLIDGLEVGRLYLGDNQFDIIFLTAEDKYDKFISYKSGLIKESYYRIHLSYFIKE